MIYITTKRPKDTEKRIKDLIIELKEREAVEDSLRSVLKERNRDLKWWQEKVHTLESDLFDSSIINDLYDKGIKNRDGYYRIVAYNPTKLDSKTVANAMSKMFGNCFDTKPIYTFNQLIKKIKSTNTDLTAYTILESNYK